MTKQPSVGFSIANDANGQPVIYVTKDAALNALSFTVTYAGNVPATLKGGAPVAESKITPQGPTSLYFTITSILTPQEFAAITVTPPAGWQAKNLTSWVLTPLADMPVTPGQSFVFHLGSITADQSPGPGAFNIDSYNIPTVADTATQLALSLEQVPSTHKRLADVMDISFRGGNAVYIDVDDQGSIPPNTLFLRLDNTALAPLVPPDTPWPNTPVFYLTFVSAAAGPGYGALTTIDRLKNITVSLAGDYGTVWTIQDRSQLSPPNWAIYPKSPEILGTGASAIVEFKIDTIVTDFQPSSTNLYLQSSYIPGYDDGVQALPIEKKPPQLAIQGFMAAANNVPAGTSVALTWRTFDANRCMLSPINGQTVPVPTQSDGAYVVTPQETTTYTLTAWNDSQGTAIAAPLTIDVQPVRFTQQLSAVPTTGVHYGDPVTLSWATSSAVACTVVPQIGGSSSVANSSAGVIVHPATSVSYTITAQGQGGPVRSSVDITPIPNGWASQANSGLWTSLGRPVLVPDFSSRLWFLAGGSGELKSSVFYSRDGFTWEFATNNAQFSPRGDAAGCVFAGKIWLLGGATAAGAVNEVWNSADGVSWTQLPATGHWSPRSRLGCLAFAGKIWVMGGALANGAPCNDVWNSADGIVWTQVTAAASWSQRQAFGTAVFNGALCIVAGSTANGLVADAWQSGDGRYWSGLGNNLNWQPRASPNVTVVANQLYVVGGTGISGKALSDSNILGPSGNWGLGLGPGWSDTTMNIASAAFIGAQWYTGGTIAGRANTTVWGFG